MTYLRVHHHIHFLRMEPTLTILISVTDNQHLVVIRCKLDMTVALLFDRVERADLVFTSVPVHLEVLLLLLLAQGLVQAVDDFFVGTALEGDGLALVVKAEIQQEDDFDASSAGLFDGSNDGAGIERRGLTVGQCKEQRRNMKFVWGR